jgi:hypothetical protein
MILGSVGGMVIPVGRSGATGLYLGGQLAGAERLAVLCVGSWQERSDWLVFLSVLVLVDSNV